jgi:hypothetical protein
MDTGSSQPLLIIYSSLKVVVNPNTMIMFKPYMSEPIGRNSSPM